jgi:DNA-directed RNA polymerase subunit RPC12/RpoP
MGKFTVDGDIGELSPGSTPRRWEPEGGVRKHNERIHRESNFADQYKNLPFSFSKPRKSGRKEYMACTNCGHIVHLSVNTVGIICNECKTYNEVKEVSFE